MTPEEALKAISAEVDRHARETRLTQRGQEHLLRLRQILKDAPIGGAWLTPVECRLALSWREYMPNGTFDPNGGLLASRLEAAS